MEDKKPADPKDAPKPPTPAKAPKTPKPWEKSKNPFDTRGQFNPKFGNPRGKNMTGVRPKH